MTEALNRNVQDYLGDMLSIEFSPCSIAAAELNRAVEAHMAGAKLAKVEMLDDVFNTDLQTVAFATTPDNLAFELPDRNPVRLAYVQPVEKTKATERVERKGFLRKAVKIEEVPVTTRKDEPILVALIEERMALPLATFARRENGECSYVQIGSEMDNDSLYATTGDDQTSRLAIVEALRDTLVVSKERFNGQPLYDVINTEITRHQEQLNDGYERYLVGRCFELINQRTEEVDMLTVEDDGSLRQQRLAYHELISPGMFADGRLANLILARNENTNPDAPDYLHLYTVTRNNLAIKLATISDLTKTISFEPAPKGAKGVLSQELMVQHLLKLFRNGVPIADNDGDSHSHNYLWKYKTDFAVAMAEMSLIPGRRIAKANQRPAGSDYRTKLKAKVMAHYAYPDVFSDDMPRWAVPSIKEKADKIRSQLLQPFAVKERIAAVTGKTTTSSEALFYMLNTLSQENGGRLNGVIPSVAMGQTKGDAEVQAEVTRTNDGTYTLLLSARPSALTAEPLRLINRLDVNIALQNADLANDERNLSLLHILSDLRD